MAEATTLFHLGSEAILIHFIAVPFVRRMERVRQQLQFAETCMHMDALSYVTHKADGAGGAEAVTDEQLVIWFLSRAPPFLGHIRLLRTYFSFVTLGTRLKELLLPSFSLQV